MRSTIKNMVSATMDHDLWSDSWRRYVTDYEVFLNFRGKDIRGGLIDIIRYFMEAAGIRCFYDDDSLHTGDVISEQLLRSIERSHVYIVMLSKNYAESKWCLRELAHMVKCQAVSNGRKVILPMFCDVTVENVKLKETSSYRATLENLSIAEKDRQEWTDALIRVGHIKGLHKGNTGDVDFSQMIVKDVRFRLRMRYLSYHLVGMDERAKSAEKLLDVESGDVRFLVIHGERGTGKTTLARSLFLQFSTRFQGSSFIPDVGEIQRHYGFENLERKLLSDICGDYGESRSVKLSFRDKKVLIVLDGVDKWQQIKKLAGMSTWFGSGSRIIITTSNREVLSIQHEVSEERNLNQAREFFGFEMEEMEFNEAAQVFSRYAFGQDSPLETFENLSRQIVIYSQRLPLILEIMGSLLHRERDMKRWEQIIQSLKDSKTVKEKLRISYDALKDSARRVFLDIACFFVNAEKTKPTYMWRSCYHNSEGIEALLEYSLVKIVDDNKLWMHDYLRELGRDIVRNNYCDPLWKHSRVWIHEEALDVLKNKELNQEVEGICLSYKGELTKLTREEFTGKCKLRFLKLYYVEFHGDFTNRLRELRWLCWHNGGEFSATNFASANLVVLDLAHSSITDTWDGWNQFKENNLRVVDLKCCDILTKTPRLSQFENLERLIIEDCTSLTEIDHSIGELRRLKCLNIKGCDSLAKLPEQICSLEMLREILITKKVCRPFSLPESIGLLKSLTILEIVRVRMAQISESIGSLENLQRLSLLGCSGFEKLPKSFGQLKSLVELDISETQIIRLPKSIRMLKELKVIKMEHSSIKKLPPTIGKVEKLEELHAKHSRDLQGEVPDGIGMLCHLKILDLSHTSLGRLPENLSQLTHLQKLQIQPCCDPQNLSQLPPKLTDLGITFWALYQVSNLSALGSTLSHLVIDTRHDHPLIERYNWELDFRGLTKLEKLELHVPNDPNLKPKFQFPDRLKSLHLSCQDLRCCSELPSSLSKLTLTNVVVNTRLPHLDNLERLSSLELLNCKLNDDSDCGGTIEICRLATLVHLSPSSCLFSIANELRPPKTLRVLNVIECEFRNTVLHLSGLKCLKRLEISYCERLVEVKGLGELELLEELIILECPSLERLEGDMSNSKRLRVFRLIDNHKLGKLEGLERVRARDLKRFEATGRSLPSANILRPKHSRHQGFD
ncbi:TMV resistance protein N-like [Punica granatum]|uniref:TMV resistance protein N-like n=1 Tax=Punica granatum TaxID=22663 RepID=A0A6P8BPC6_PUNGR|nr:TMV resistance protein N-like [Punica granatum]XP_031371702.1 TMV resistance protein N-like [Punica granatum]